MGDIAALFMFVYNQVSNYKICIQYTYGKNINKEY